MAPRRNVSHCIATAASFLLFLPCDALKVDVLRNCAVTSPGQKAHVPRRALLALVSVSQMFSMAELARGLDTQTIIAKGTVVLKGQDRLSSSEEALYVTVRPAPLSSLSAGKVPPLATARYSGPISFPFDFELTTADLTEEYLGAPESTWIGQDLLVAARLDQDGKAATRDPNDLVRHFPHSAANASRS